MNSVSPLGANDGTILDIQRRLAGHARTDAPGSPQRTGAVDAGKEKAERRHMEEALRQAQEELKEHAEELATLYAIAQMMNRSSNLDRILQLALDSALEMAGMDCGAILLLDPTNEYLLLRVSRGGSSRFLRAINRIKVGQDLLPHMLESIVVLDDPCEVVPRRRAAIEQEGLQSVVCIPLQITGSPQGVMSIASHSPRELQPQEVRLLAAIGNQVGVALERAHLQEQQLRIAVLEERQAVARHMHDDIAQTLGYLGLQVDGLMDSPSLCDNAETLAGLERVRTAIEEAYERVRQSIARLRQDLPDRLDFGAALQEIIGAFEKQTGCKIESDIDPEHLPHLSSLVAVQASYIVREALTNIRKHAGADRIQLAFRSAQGGMFELTIQDNGVGFSPEDERAGQGGYGLRFMRERAEHIGGSLRVESQLGQGTRVIAHLPSS